MVKDRIGQGAFGDVYTTDYRAPGKITTETVVIKKNVKCSGRRREETFLFFEEVAPLNSLKHQSVVKFMAVCHQPLAMIPKYVYFDFHLFGQAVRVNTLFEFLLKIYAQKCDGFHDLVCHVATEVIDGLGYLHNQRIAHRDLKTADILVSSSKQQLQQAQDVGLGNLDDHRRFPVDVDALLGTILHFLEEKALYLQSNTELVVECPTYSTTWCHYVYA